MSRSGVRTPVAVVCLLYLAATRTPGTEARLSLTVLALATFIVITVLGPRFVPVLKRLRPYGFPATIILVLLPASEHALIQAPWMATMAVVLVLLHQMYPAPRQSVERSPGRKVQLRQLLQWAFVVAILAAAGTLAHFLPHVLPDHLAAVHEIRHLGASVLAALVIASVLVVLAWLRELVLQPSISAATEVSE